MSKPKKDSNKINKPIFVGTPSSFSDEFGQNTEPKVSTAVDHPDARFSAFFTLPGWDKFAVGERPNSREFIFPGGETKITVDFINNVYEISKMFLRPNKHHWYGKVVETSSGQVGALSCASEWIKEIKSGMKFSNSPATEKSVGKKFDTVEESSIDEKASGFSNNANHTFSEFDEALHKKLQSEEIDAFMERIARVEKEVEKTYVIKNKHLQEKLEDAERIIDSLQDTIVDNSNDFSIMQKTINGIDREMAYVLAKLEDQKKLISKVCTYFLILLFLCFVITAPLLGFFIEKAVEIKSDSFGRTSLSIKL